MTTGALPVPIPQGSTKTFRPIASPAALNTLSRKAKHFLEYARFNLHMFAKFVKILQIIIDL
jgi:hypothetical protein